MANVVEEKCIQNCNNFEIFYNCIDIDKASVTQCDNSSATFYNCLTCVLTQKYKIEMFSRLKIDLALFYYYSLLPYY